MRLHSFKWLLLIGLIAGGFQAVQSISHLQQWFRRHQFRIEGLEEAVPSQVYFLHTNRWLEFDIPIDVPLVRLISNASVAPESQTLPGTRWPYAIEYQLLGRHGQMIAEGIYHFIGEQLAFLDKQSGKPVEVNFYLERQFRPLGGRRCLLNLNDPAMAGAEVLRVRLHSRHPDLLEVALRAHFQLKIPERKVAYMWNRLSDDQRRDLVRGNVYSFEGLTEREKHGLLRYRWAAAAPHGIPGRDFERRTLHIRDDSESMEMLQEWVPSGIPLDAAHRGVLPITNAPGQVHVQLIEHPPVNESETVSSALLWHSGRQPVETNWFNWSGTNQALLPANREGFIEITASRPVSVRSFLVEPGRTNEITPEALHITTFTVSPTNTLEYVVEHTGRQHSFMRVDLRRFTPSADTAALASGIVHYALAARDGNVIQAGDVLLTNTFSAYDWLVTTNGLTNITAPQSLCFELPAEIGLLSISSPLDTVFVNAFSRPSQLVKRVQVPEDNSPANRLNPEQPSWFTLRPPDHLQRRNAAQFAMVRVQANLPEHDPLVLAGQYEWESFLPGNESLGQMVLLPPSEGPTPRPGSLPFSYFPVALNQEQSVRLQGDPWERQVAPSLMLISTSEAPGSATVMVDGRTLVDQPLETAVTQIRLGYLSIGEHRLNVEANRPVSAFMNHLESTSPAAYLQRFCVMANSNALRFPYLKRQEGAEVLVLRVFSPAETNTQSFQVRLKLTPATTRGIGPFPELTLLEREVWVTPNPTRRTRLVAATPSQLDDGQPVYLRVGSDLPPGEHELEVTVLTDSPRWLSLSRTTPGLAEKLELSSKRRVD